jgi:hypothetical protein
MSFLRFILLFILFYAIFKVVKLFVLNFRLGAKSNNNFQRENRHKSKYDDVEEAEFTEIETKEKNHNK